MRVHESIHDSAVTVCAGVFKALSDPTRVRIVNLLTSCGELCVCDVEVILSISQSRASRHLCHLKNAGIVADRRDRTWVYYRVARPAHPMVRSALRELRRALEDDPVAASDIESAARRSRDGSCAPITAVAASSSSRRG